MRPSCSPATSRSSQLSAHSRPQNTAAFSSEPFQIQPRGVTDSLPFCCPAVQIGSWEDLSSTACSCWPKNVFHIFKGLWGRGGGERICDRDPCVAHTVWTVYCLTLSRKSLRAPGLDASVSLYPLLKFTHPPSVFMTPIFGIYLFLTWIWDACF